MRRTPLTMALLLTCVLAAETSAQKQLQLAATILDREGKPASSVSPEDVQVSVNGVEAKVLKVEAIEWTTKVQILIDNGPGIGPGGLVPLRNGLRALLEALPPGLEATLVTTAPQPRFLVRATTDRQALLAGIDRLAPDSSPGRFVESLGEALQRFERDKGDFFGVIVTLGTTQGDNKALDRDINEIFATGAEEADDGSRGHGVHRGCDGQWRRRSDGRRDGHCETDQWAIREHQRLQPPGDPASGNRRPHYGRRGKGPAVPSDRRAVRFGCAVQTQHVWQERQGRDQHHFPQ